MPGKNSASFESGGIAVFTGRTRQMPKSWGLTFMINMEDAPTGRTAGSLASAGLANSYYWIDPSKGVGGVYLTQVLPFADKKCLPLYFDFERTVYPHLS